MICAWDHVLGVLPLWLRRQVEEVEAVQEIRLRLGKPTELIFSDRRQWLGQAVSSQDLSFTVNAASRYSPWSAASAALGYVTAQGGHRIGICGEAVLREGTVTGIREVSSLCIRVARDFPGIAEKAGELTGSILILGAPGWGKTTLLRDLIRQRSRFQTVGVVDARRELFPQDFDRGRQTDVLYGCPKAVGLGQLLRTMGPETLAVDEITSQEDCTAILHAGNCGVSLLATAHAGSLEDFKNRKLYESLWKSGLFQHYLVLHPDQSYDLEEIKQ